HVFRNLARLEPHDDDFLNPRLVQRLYLGGSDRRAFLEHQRALTQGMNGDAADGISRTGRAKFHAATSFSWPIRKVAVISAMIATAISEGDTAPIERPMGAWMRARSLSFAPCAFSRSARLAWVFREPSAPM